MWTSLRIAAVAYDQKRKHYMFLFLAGFNSEMKIENQQIHAFICDCRPLKSTLFVQNVSIGFIRSSGHFYLGNCFLSLTNKEKSECPDRDECPQNCSKKDLYRGGACESLVMRHM